MTFLFSSAAATQADAAQNCFLRNMSLISVQDVLKMNLVQKLLTDVGTDSAVWTIGSNEGNLSCQNYDLSFAWCNPKREIVLPTIMQKINSLDLVQKGLTTLMLNGVAALKTSDSNLMFPFLCEPKDDFLDSCLALKCNKDSKLLDANGNIKDGEKYGKWTFTCDKMYLFSGKIGTWQQSWDLCCSLGMKPISFSSASDFECLSNTTKDMIWTKNWNYWTAGRAMGTWGRWAWCPGAVNLPDSLSWAPGQPDNNQTDENCLHLQVTKNSSGILLSDRNCSHKFVIACQGDVLMTPDCNKPNCPKECSKNESIFSLGTIKDLFVHGHWHAGCGKDYLFSAEALDWLGAWKYCCALGMKLASVEYIEELSCLTNMVAQYPKADYFDQYGRDFWTSGTNRGCPGAHYWCSANDKLNKAELANWKNGQMPSESADQCMFINLSNSTLSETYLGAASCTEQKPFLCETMQSGISSARIRRFCSAIWGVTDDDIDLVIMNPYADVVNQRRDLKCYLRCCGKLVRVIEDGLLVTDKVLRDLEGLTAFDPEVLQFSFEKYLACISIQAPDECTLTALMFQCAKMSGPEIARGLVTVNKGDDTAHLESPTGGIKTAERMCPLYPAASCVPNQANIDELKNSGSTLGGNMLTTSTGKKYFIKYVPPGTTDFQGEEECCKLGSHLAIFESLEDYNTFLKEWPDTSGHWAYIGPTYDNGDGTDSWCSTFKKLPAGLITDTNTFYRNQQWSSTQIYFTKDAGILLAMKGTTCNKVLCGPLPW
ncbi:Hypothetical predicted protein [Cloeon dipterum]|nr:Hypothetical predicted protein [Cloeon dipterum]